MYKITQHHQIKRMSLCLKFLSKSSNEFLNFRFLEESVPFSSDTNFLFRTKGVFLIFTLLLLIVNNNCL